MKHDSQSRRHFLRASGIGLALPVLEALQPSAFAAGATTRRRMVCINVGLGLHAPNMIPTATGRDFEAPTYLKLLDAHRKQLTVLSGVANPEVGGGHSSYKSFLTGAPHPNSAGFRNSISVDQYAAASLGSETRFASLALSSAGPSLSWSRSGVEIPTYTRPSKLFKKLFLAGKPEEQARQLQRLQDGQSILDMVMGPTRRMQSRISGADREKLDQYFEAIREAERRLEKAEAWSEKPKPMVDAKEPRDEADGKKIIQCMDLLYDVMHLALETDSTRFITYNQTGMNAVPVVPGVDIDYHNLSHHGKDPEKIAQLTLVESALIQCFGRFLKKLAGTQEGGQNLLDETMVLFGSNLGNASSHDTRNLPILLAGGPFEHGQHLAFDRVNNEPLTNLYVSMLQGLGMETDRFSSGTRTLPGLSPA